MSEGLRTLPRFEVDGDFLVKVEVHDQDVVERITGPGGDEWRSRFYPLRTADDVMRHIAYNAVMNGTRDVSQLEGWADLDSKAVTIWVDANTTGWSVRRGR